MTDWLLAAMADFGAPLLFVATFASCLALPLPASLLMLSGGAFVATGDLAVINVVSAAMFGAVIGDQVGFRLGRAGQAQLDAALARRPKRAALMARARDLIDRWGGPGVFLSRWLFSPLGPYVNFAGGAAGQNGLRFFIWGAMGEAVWVGLYVGLGYLFADNILMAAELAGDVLGLLAALMVMVGAAWWMRHTGHRTNRGRKSAPSNLD